MLQEFNPKDIGEFAIHSQYGVIELIYNWTALARSISNSFPPPTVLAGDNITNIPASPIVVPTPGVLITPAAVPTEPPDSANPTIVPIVSNIFHISDTAVPSCPVGST